MGLDIRKCINTARSSVYVPRSSRDRSGVDSRVAASADRTSVIAEQYRIVQTELEAIFKGREMRTIVITSSGRDEGKTITCCNLAMTFASNSEKRSVLVDCDMRKPDIHTFLNIKRSPGLSEILTGAAGLDDVIRAPAVDNLYVIPAGAPTSNPAELLRRAETARFINTLKLKFDHVIIDTPPILPVSDSRIIAAACDAVIMVVRSERAKKKAVKEAFWLLETARIKPAACILTDYEAPAYHCLNYSSY